MYKIEYQEQNFMTRDSFSKNFISINGVKMKLTRRIKNVVVSFSYRIDFMAYGLRRDHSPA